ncbi:MAG: hypothetical protein K0R48_870 [Gammaproteobacteria bacterium]|jgi:hypothetical protein|nr:hypothetical protein [Gammaproteobacteria bacterium]
MKVSINDISEVLLAHSVDSPFYLNLKNGEVLEQSSITPGQTEAYAPLPLLAEARTIGVCWEYTEEIDEIEIRHELQAILRHVDEEYEFSEFTEALYYHGLEEDWETYKEERLLHILADWCEHKGIDYND